MDRTAPATALSRSASSNTIKGAFPPSSMLNFLSVLEDCCMSNFPTLVDPVKDNLLICMTSDQFGPFAAIGRMRRAH